MWEVEGLFAEHQLLFLVLIVVVGTFYHRIQELIELQKQQRQHVQYQGLQRRASSRKSITSSNSFPDEVAISSTFSSSRSSGNIRTKLATCEKVIQSLQNELQSTTTENSKLKAALETAQSSVEVMKQKEIDSKKLLEKERSKVMALQSKQHYTPSELFELEWEKAGAMISLVTVQKEIYELESSISMHRLEVVQKQKLLEVERQCDSLEELVGTREDSEAFLQAEQQRLRAIHDALEESIRKIEGHQEKLMSEQFDSFEELIQLQRQEQVLKATIEERESDIVIQKQQRVQLQRFVDAEKEKSRNQLETSKIKMEVSQRKLEGVVNENEYNQQRVEDLQQLLKAETKRAEELKGDGHKTDAIVRMKDTQIESLNARLFSLKEKEAEQQEVIDKLRRLHEQEKERVENAKTQAEKVVREKREHEDALEKMNLKMEAKLEAMSKQKIALKEYEQAHAAEKAKSRKINEQLPQLYNLIKTEESKGIKLQEEINETKGQLLKEKLKTQQLQKELSNVMALAKKNEGDMMIPAEGEWDRKAWFWKKQ